MANYEELVKSLRICAEGEHCDKCGKWEVKENGGRNACEEAICTDAADAIEELQKQLQKSEVDNINLTGWLAEEHANNCPHYIRNVHDRGDDSLCDVLMTEPPKEET